MRSKSRQQSATPRIYLLILIPILILFLRRPDSSGDTSSTTTTKSISGQSLPPPLSRLPLPPRPSSTSKFLPHDTWKTPSVLTVYATAPTRASQNVTLVFLTTGIHAKSYERVFHPIGCLVGNAIYGIVALDWERVTCVVQRNQLKKGAWITLVLRKDDALKQASMGPQRLHGELFQLHRGDIRELIEMGLHVANATVRREMRRFGGGGVMEMGRGLKWNARFLEEEEEDAEGDGKVAPRYELCLMTVMKQYPFLLARWIEYYRKMGVDHVYIYDNGAEEDLRETLAPWKGFAESLYWPWPRSQMQSNNHFLLAGARRCRWVAFFDADEFVMVGGAGTEHDVNATEETEEKLMMDDGVEANVQTGLKDYVKERSSRGFKQMSFHFIEMINSGFVRRPQGDLPELYTTRAKTQEMGSAKVVVDMRSKWLHHRIHLVMGEDSKRYYNRTLELEPRDLKDNAMLVHYTRRSWEDFVAKNSVGGASVLTAGRPRKVLDVELPDEDYMNEPGVVWNGFKERWRKIMEREDDGKKWLVWADGNGRECRRWVCAGCAVEKGTAVCEGEGDGDGEGEEE